MNFREVHIWKKINDSQFVSSLRDWRSGLDADPSGIHSSTVNGRTSQLEFEAAANREIASLEAIQATSGNQHEHVEFGFRITEELLEDEKEMLENMSEIRC